MVIILGVPIFRIFMGISISDEITTVRLHFSDEINLYNSSSLNVRQALAEILCHNLAQVSEQLDIVKLCHLQ